MSEKSKEELKKEAAEKAKADAKKRLEEMQAGAGEKAVSQEDKAEAKRKAAEQAKQKAAEMTKQSEPEETSAENTDTDLAKKKAAAAAKAKAAALAKQKAKEETESEEAPSEQTDIDVAKQKAAAAAKAKAAAAAKAKASGAAGEDDEKAKAKAAAAAKAKAAAAAKAKASGATGEDDEKAKAKAAAVAKAKAAAAAKAKTSGAGKDDSTPTEEEKPSVNQPYLDKYVRVIEEHLGKGVLEDAYINRLSKDVPTLVTKPDTYYKVAEFLKYNEQLGFDYLSEHHGSDFESHMEIYNHLYSYKNKQSVALKVKIDRDQPEIDSLTPLWAGANWPERESYDLVGVKYKNHPDLTRIMLTDDWVGHPLRKDYDQYDVEV